MKPVLRDWIREMDEKGMLRRISREVDPVSELAAVGKRLEPGSGAYFEKVRGSDIPVITGLATSRERMAASLGLSFEELLERFGQALEAPTPCILAPSEGHPVKERVLKGDQVDLGLLPACLHHEKDSARYLTAALCIVRDPRTGIRNVSIHRHEIRDRNHLGALLLPRHTSQIFSWMESHDEPLEAALVIGVHPALLLASQATTPLGVDELEIAGSLLQEPLELVRCETVDLEVPAESEIVLEGRFLPHVRQEEGPFGEYPKTYGMRGPRPVLEITAMTFRSRPIYHTIIPASMEHLLLGGIPREAVMRKVIAQVSPYVKGVHLTPAGGCRYHAVISLEQRYEGEAKNVMFAAFSSSTEVKHVVVVDPDIDIYDSQDVEWAIANRVQAARDVIIIPDAMGNRLDPSSRNGVSDKMGIDATVPMNGNRERFQKIRIAGFEAVDPEQYI